ncbi:MAG TPA: hypothetical protein GX525_06495 [Bacilli bacterium]|nr:hypothetical protein [Bacilli bacterium]
MKKLAFLLTFVFAIGLLVACGGGNEKPAEGGQADTEQEPATTEEKKDLKIGATAGPFSDMVLKAIKPIMEEEGYTVELVEFSDYIQPNLALSTGDIDANLFQHKIYMENFAKEHNIDISEVIIVPTAPMGIYSKKYTSLDEIEDGTELAMPSDPTNGARAFGMLEDAGLIKISESADPLTISEKDVVENPKNLKFSPVEAAQLPRLVDSVDLVAVPGNFALAAKMNLLDALQLEDMSDDYRNRVVINTKDLDSEFAKAIKAAVESEKFEQIIDEEFKGFGKPEWMENR